VGTTFWDGGYDEYWIIRLHFQYDLPVIDMERDLTYF